MDQEKVIKLDRFCAAQIFDALEHIKAAAFQIEDRWFPTAVRLEISRHYISLSPDSLAYTVLLKQHEAIIYTRNCVLIVYPDAFYLYKYAGSVEEVGRYVYVDPNYYFTEKEVYSAHEIYTLIKQIFEKAVRVALSIINP
jgi:hypothetical protein